MELRKTQVQCADDLGEAEGNNVSVEKKKREKGTCTARSETLPCLYTTYAEAGRARVCPGGMGRKGKSKDTSR